MELGEFRQGCSTVQDNIRSLVIHNKFETKMTLSAAWVHDN